MCKRTYLVTAVLAGVALLLFSSVILSLPKDTFAGTIDLPQTGQTKCCDSMGAEVACASTGQDGEIRAGVAWPSPRFTVGTGAEADCVTDNLTGLMWAKNGNMPNGTKTWDEALDYVASLNSSGGLCGYTDWRLPNINELESLINADESDTASWLNTQGFTNVQSGGYWSSTAYASLTNYAWYVKMWEGYMGYNYKGSIYHYPLYVWPVRSGQTGIVQLPKTGQTTSYSVGDDGNLERGVAWPSPRFTDNGNGTVTDNLTGLIWLKNANCFGFRNWATSLTDANTLNSGECGLSDGSIEGDWRLPNRKELRSLIDYSNYNPALPTGHPFINVQSFYYWSSTTYAGSTNRAWYVDMWYGYVVYYHYKDDASYVWPVRSGQSGSFDYYCDDDGDGYIDSSIDGTCSGSGCVPVGCQTTSGDDCDDNNASINPGATEICDGIDDDCDGSVDEGCPCFNNSECSEGWYCEKSEGNCSGAGVCVVKPDICTQVYDPVCGCDRETYSNSGCAAVAGISVDYHGVCGFCYPGVEVCDGLDNDCDGTVDDGIASTPTTCGVGACASTGTLSCVGGAMVDSCTPGTPSAETCNGIDDDCNGSVDEGGVCALNLPDLTGQWTSMGVKQALSGWMVYGNLKVTNQGSVDAGSFVIKFYYIPSEGGSPQYLRQRSLLGRPAGRTTNVTFRHMFSSNHSGGSILAVIDDNNAVAESNEGNNEDTKSIP